MRRRGRKSSQCRARKKPRRCSHSIRGQSPNQNHMHSCDRHEEGPTKKRLLRQIFPTFRDDKTSSSRKPTIQKLLLNAQTIGIFRRGTWTPDVLFLSSFVTSSHVMRDLACNCRRALFANFHSVCVLPNL